MSTVTKPPAAGARGYKRSWKNLLINKRYQLRFTLVMAGLAAVLMTALGYWVMKVANDATDVGKNWIKGEPCPAVPKLAETGPIVDDDAAVAPPVVPLSGPLMEDREPAPDPGPPDPNTDDPNAGSGSAGAGSDTPIADQPDPDRPRTKVVIDESSLKITAIVPPDFVEQATHKWACQFRQAGGLAALERGRMQILYVLIATGVMLILGLSFYGIKMTHRVAGPLFKVSLYMAKMRDGRLDKVYNLRKGDQLVSFYDHFKQAHDGLVGMEKADIERLRAMLDEIDKGDPPASMTEKIAELREMLARKEKSLE